MTREIVLEAFGRKVFSFRVKDDNDREFNKLIPKHKPKPKVESIIPENMMGSYRPVEAAIMANLGVTGGETGDYPLAYGEMGGSESPLHSLTTLNEANISDETIIKAFMKSDVVKEFKEDKDIAQKAMSALRAVRGGN